MIWGFPWDSLEIPWRFYVYLFILQELEKDWQVIRDEGVEQLDSEGGFPRDSLMIWGYPWDSLEIPWGFYVYVIILQELEKNWQVIRDEGVAQLDSEGGFRPEEENLRDTGDWKQFTLYQQGKG